MRHSVDVHVGGRIRQRRMLLGITQQTLGENLGITFQQVQKYEIGANRVSASRLWAISRLLGVPIGYFFEGLGVQRPCADSRADSRDGAAPPPATDDAQGADRIALDTLAGLSDVPFDRDAAALLRNFCAIPAEKRRRLLELARALSGDSAA